MYIYISCICALAAECIQICEKYLGLATISINEGALGTLHIYYESDRVTFLLSAPRPHILPSSALSEPAQGID